MNRDTDTNNRLVFVSNVDLFKYVNYLCVKASYAQRFVMQLTLPLCGYQCSVSYKDFHYVY